ncbi:class I SAM-dependent methyltransferase [Streptomyces sp. NPDC006285]|uniref:class I SAM-dependent methyltransferase n=1 Tax=Streptomyces sp. NPDC006285 TaxID=3364742 RepID=UPI0036B19DE9
MDTTRGDETRKDEDQRARWNGTAGHAWVEAQSVIDELFKPFEELLVEAVAAGHGRRVLDVGCGTGSTTLAVARRIGAYGPGGVELDAEVGCVGVDVSEPMITAARARAERAGAERAGAAGTGALGAEAVGAETVRGGPPVSFVLADAQEHAFEPGTFDTVISRFGVMFFRDAVRAFANLRRAASDNAGLTCITWRGPEENPFMTTAERAARPLMPDLPVRRPDEPGQFAFADPDRVRRILEDSGWTGVDIRPLDVVCTLPESELVPYFSRFGPLGLVLREADERTRARVVEAVRAAFDPFVRGPEVRFTAACWTVRATAGGSPA